MAGMDLAKLVADAFPPRKKSYTLPAIGSIPLGSIVEIRWIDANTYGIEWETVETAKNRTSMTSISVGYLVSDTPEHISIAMILNTEAIGSGLVIPRGCVQDITWIK